MERWYFVILQPKSESRATAPDCRRVVVGHFVGPCVLECYRETRWLGMHKQVGTRAGNYQRHTQQTLAHQHRLTTRHDSWTAISQPGRFRHLANTPHAHQTAPCATQAPDTRAQLPPRARQGALHPSTLLRALQPTLLGVVLRDRDAPYCMNPVRTIITAFQPYIATAQLQQDFSHAQVEKLFLVTEYLAYLYPWLEPTRNIKTRRSLRVTPRSDGQGGCDRRASNWWEKGSP